MVREIKLPYLTVSEMDAVRSFLNTSPSISEDSYLRCDSYVDVDFESIDFQSDDRGIPKVVGYRDVTFSMTVPNLAPYTDKEITLQILSESRSAKHDLAELVGKLMQFS